MMPQIIRTVDTKSHNVKIPYECLVYSLTFKLLISKLLVNDKQNHYMQYDMAIVSMLSKRFQLV